MRHTEFYEAFSILSRNAIINEILSNRNYGKTWLFKKRACKRAFKHGKKTIWLRTFENETKECIKSFFSSSDLREFCGIELYNSETKKGNVKRIGNTFYYRKNKTWEWFIKIFSVSDVGDIRSSDDVKIDTLVYDECLLTEKRERRYVGNRIDDFCDIFFTLKRYHKLSVFLLGNREIYINPFHTYFKIPQIDLSKEQIRTFKNGSFAIQIINNEQPNKSDYDKKLRSLFNDTSYGNYIYEDETKNETKVKIGKPSSNASLYIQLSINGHELTILNDNGFFYVKDGIVNTRRVFVLKIVNKYQYECLLVNRHKNYLTSFKRAYEVNCVYYENASLHYKMMDFYRWLGY